MLLKYGVVVSKIRGATVNKCHFSKTKYEFGADECPRINHFDDPILLTILTAQICLETGREISAFSGPKGNLWPYWGQLNQTDKPNQF